MVGELIETGLREGLHGPRTRQVDVDDFLNAAGACRHHQDAVGQQQRFGNRVGDEQHRLRTLGPDIQQLQAQLVAGQGVECRERLVHQQDFRVVQQRPGNRRALLHAAGEFVRALVAEFLEPHQFQQLLAAGDLLGGDTAVLVAHGKGQVVADVQPRQQRRLLEDDADLVARTVHRAAVDADLAVGRSHQPGEDAQQRGLAAARGAEHGDELVAADVETGVVQRHHLAAIGGGEDLADPIEADVGARRGGQDGSVHGFTRSGWCRWRWPGRGHQSACPAPWRPIPRWWPDAWRRSPGLRHR